MLTKTTTMTTRMAITTTAKRTRPNRSRFSRERRSWHMTNPKRRACEKTRNRDIRENCHRSRNGDNEGEGERERELLATHVTHGARDNFARITSSCQRAASSPDEEETRFRFFRLMRLSRRISYGRTVEEKFLRTYSKLCFPRNHDEITENLLNYRLSLQVALRDFK